VTKNKQNSEAQEPRALSASERIFVRISLWQTLLSVLGVFVGAVALYAALTESEAVRRQTAAAVWPYAQLTISDYETADNAEFKLSLAGVGPAQVRAMRVMMAGSAQHDWANVIAAAGGGDAPFAQASVQNRVLRPGESVEILGVLDPTAVRALRAAVARGEGSIEYCYCSIFEQCWVADTDAHRGAVRQCPDYGAEAFTGAAAPEPR
jgi:hypothetical protein